MKTWITAIALLLASTSARPEAAAAIVDGIIVDPNQALVFKRAFSKTDSFGDADWGAGYTVGGSIGYKPASVAATAGDVITGDGRLNAWARLAGTQRSLLDVRGSAHGEKNNAAATLFDVAVYLGNAKIYCNEWTGTFAATPRTFSATFFKLSQTYIVGVVPVTATMSAAGSLGFEANGRVSPAGQIDVLFLPKGEAHAVVQAGVGIENASAGAYGELSLIRAELPTSLGVDLTVDRGTRKLKVTYAVDSDLDLWSLDGEIGLYAELGDRRWERELFGWDGLYTQFPVYSISGVYCPGGCQ